MPAGLPCGMPGNGLAMEGAMQQAPQPGRQCGGGSEGEGAAMAHPEGERAAFTRRHTTGSPHQTSAGKVGRTGLALVGPDCARPDFTHVRARVARRGKTSNLAMRREALGIRAPRFLKRASGRYSRRGHDDGAQGNEGGTMQETRRAVQAAPAAPREDAAALRTMRR